MKAGEYWFICSNHKSWFPLLGTTVCTHWKNVNIGWRVLPHDQATVCWMGGEDIQIRVLSCWMEISATLYYQSCFCCCCSPPPFYHLIHLSFPDGLAAFRTFLKTEFSDENIEFWMACEEYKKIKSSTKLVSKANKIFKEFIDIQAPREVCVCVWLVCVLINDTVNIPRDCNYQLFTYSPDLFPFHKELIFPVVFTRNHSTYCFHRPWHVPALTHILVLTWSSHKDSTQVHT